MEEAVVAWAGGGSWGALGEGLSLWIPWLWLSLLFAAAPWLRGMASAAAHDATSSSMGNTFNAFERPHTIDDATSLEEYALTWVNQIDCGQIVVGMTTKDQVDFANRWITNNNEY